MRVCFRKLDNRIIESQSGGNESHLDALISNAVSSGYKADEVRVLKGQQPVTAAQFNTALKAQMRS